MKVSKVNVVNPGRGWFDEAPIVSLHGGGGTGAQCVAVVDKGAVKEVRVVDGGVNYSGAPEVRFSGGGKSVGFGTEAYADVVEGGKPFADQPVPKPENPPKEAKSTPPVRAEVPREEAKPMQALKPKPTPDEAPGQQHTEGGPAGMSVTDQVARAQFNPGGNPAEDPKAPQPSKPEQPTTAPTPKPARPAFQPTPAKKPAPSEPAQPPAAPPPADKK